MASSWRSSGNRQQTSYAERLRAATDQNEQLQSSGIQEEQQPSSPPKPQPQKSESPVNQPSPPEPASHTSTYTKTRNVWEERRRQQQRVPQISQLDTQIHSDTTKLAAEPDDAWLTRIHILNGGEHLKKYGREKSVAPAPGALCCGSAPANIECPMYPPSIPFLAMKDGSFSPLRPHDAGRTLAPSSVPGYMSMPYAQVYMPYVVGEPHGAMPVMMPMWDGSGMQIMPITPLPPAYAPLPLDSNATLHQLLAHVESYFSASNIGADGYLRKQMDEQGFVPLDAVRKCNAIRPILSTASAASNIGSSALNGQTDMEILRRALKPSRVLEMNCEETHVRRSEGRDAYVATK